MTDSRSAAGLPTERDMLFADLPLEYCASMGTGEVPGIFFKEVEEKADQQHIPEAIELLKNITTVPGLGSRQYLQAYFFINELQGFVEGAAEIFGVVLEVSMPGGHDIVAVYADHSARYFNYSGKTIFWERPDDSLDKAIDEILNYGAAVIARIGPWKGQRPGPTRKQIARVSFLTSHGLYFGEAPQLILFHDPMAGKIMFAMLDIAKALIDKTEQI